MLTEYVVCSPSVFVEKGNNKPLIQSKFKQPYKLYVPSMFPMRLFEERTLGFFLTPGSENISMRKSVHQQVDVMDTLFWKVYMRNSMDYMLQFWDSYNRVWRTVAFQQSIAVMHKMKNMITLFSVPNSGRPQMKWEHTPNKDCFRSIGGLYSIPAGFKGDLNLGLSLREFSIVYNGRTMNGSCKVLFFNTLACLLKDNLEIDAIVVLDGAVGNGSKNDSGIFGDRVGEGNTLVVRDLIWTQNGYITKFVFMHRSTGNGNTV